MKRTLVALGILGFVCGAVQAQEAKPGPDLKKLDILAGNWTGQQSGKNLEGVEYEAEWSQQTQRMGDFFYVVRGTWKNADEKGEYMRITGYDPIKKAYFSRQFYDNGTGYTAAVTFGDKTSKEDRTWFTPSGGEARERCTSEFSEAEVTYECERYTDGKWASSTKGKGTKVK